MLGETGWLMATHGIMMHLCNPDSVTPDGSTLTLLRLSPEDSGTYTCSAFSPAGQESKIYTLFVLGQLELLYLCICVSPEWFTFNSIWPCCSPSIHLWGDHCPQGGAGHTGQRRNSGVSGGRKPSTSNQLAEERTSAAPLSPCTPPLWWLCAEVSLDKESWKQTWFVLQRDCMFISELMLNVPFSL